MSKLQKYSDFSKEPKEENLLIESCGTSNISSCGGGSPSKSSADIEAERTAKIKRKRNELIDDLTHSCPKCTSSLAKDAKFCQECGNKVPDDIRNT